MGLRTRFNLILFMVFAVGIVAAGGVSYYVARENARESVLQEARILYETALAIRGYTAREIRPLLTALGEDQFLTHTIPSFAAQYNFRTMQGRFPDYSYKEAALNPTNPNDLATGWEVEVIEGFRVDGAPEERVVIRDTPEGTVLTLAHAIRITNDACLACHSTPDRAPASMIALYGDEGGFGWTMDEVIGAQLVSVPMSVPEERALRQTMISLGMIIAVFVTIMIALNIALHAAVIGPIRKISDVANEVSMGNLEAPDYTVNRKDEIGVLSQSFNRMRRSLASALRMIDT